MNPTRRSLCGLGLASMPLAMLGPRVLSAEQHTAGTPDAFLAYLIEDTKRNCRLAGKPGRERASHVRRLGANAEVLMAYVLSHEPAGGIKTAIGRLVAQEGADGLAFRMREKWPTLAASLTADYAVAVPADLDHATVTTAISRLQRHGCPRLTGIRGWFEREAARIEQWEGAPLKSIVVRQTPGNDFGPDGWSAGLGDGDREISCHEMAVMIAALGLIAEFVPEVGAMLRCVIPIVTLLVAIACG